ncbi:MAG: hypothetical protein IJ671_04845 [Succinivibrio sp.]|nr:hypothetical protein [Succinivibrio sp.]
MVHRFRIHCSDKKCLEVSKATSTTLVYKVAYNQLKDRSHDLDISNRFIVYILFGKNMHGKDFIYVGKSKNGIDNRPTSHEDKNSNWDMCYILTNFKERTFLNDGTIQFIEDSIQKQINKTERFQNTTKTTSTDTANSSEEDDCRAFLDEAYEMLNVLGLDLITLPSQADDEIGTNRVDMKPEIEKLYNEIILQAKSVNNDIKLAYTKHYINVILDGDILFSIEPTTKDLKLYLNANIKDLPPSSCLTDVSNIGHHSSGQTLMRVEDNSNFDLLKTLINEIINL